MRKNGFKKDLPALPPREFFHVYIIKARSSSCNFSFLKNSPLQINSKLNSKPYHNLQTLSLWALVWEFRRTIPLFLTLNKWSYRSSLILACDLSSTTYTFLYSCQCMLCLHDWSRLYKLNFYVNLISLVRSVLAKVN